MTAASVPVPAPQTVDSVLLGRIAVEDRQCFDFPDGVPGFPSCRRWVLVDASRPGCAWLQSLDESAVSFFVIDPFRVLPDYAIDLSRIELDRLRSRDARDVAVLAIVTFPASPTDAPTANLQAPVVLDVETRRGAQIVLTDSSWGLRHPIALPGAA